MKFKIFRDLLESIVVEGEKGFEKLYNMYSGRLFSVAYWILKDKNMAISVMDDVLIQLYNQPLHFLKVKSPDTWLFTVAKNRALKLKIKQNRIHSREVFAPKMLEKVELCDIDSNIDFYDLLTEHFNELEQKLIILRVIWDMTYASIAKSMEMSIAQVVWAFRRIKFTLKKHLAKGSLK